MPIALPDDLLDRIRSRARGYDRDNAFFREDLDELAASGYLRCLVPTSFGGAGAPLLDVVRSQSRLAEAAPATALGVGMHLIWTSVARMLHDGGDDCLDFLLRDAAAGEIIAFAISEPDNDLVLLGSDTDARPTGDGGYAFTGVKVFTSLSPAWTRLGTFGLDSTSADAPRLVHAVLTRDAPGISIGDDWDTVGMRATQSHTTRLDGAVAEPSRVFRRLEPGPNADPLILAIFTSFEILIAAVYVGIGERALQLAVESATSRRSARTGAARSADPAIRRRIASIAMSQDGLRPRLESLAADVDHGVDHGDQWFRRLVGLKVAATRGARSAVEQAIAVTGGSSMRSGSELGRLYRDVLAGGFHPSNDDSAESTIATAVLGPVD